MYFREGSAHYWLLVFFESYTASVEIDVLVIQR